MSHICGVQVDIPLFLPSEGIGRSCCFGITDRYPLASADGCQSPFPLMNSLAARFSISIAYSISEGSMYSAASFQHIQFTGFDLTWSEQAGKD